MAKKINKNGYVALISLILIGAIILAAVLSLTFMSLSQRESMIKRNRSLRNFYLSDACAHEALVKLQKDLNYSGNETIAIDGESCQIQAISGSGNFSRTIIAASQIANQQKKIKVEISQLRPKTIINFWGETF